MAGLFKLLGVHTMNAQEINHAQGLIASLLKKAALLRQQADDCDNDKDGRSRMAVSLRLKAADCEQHAEELKAAADAQFWLAR
jgi:hypothetical protein